MLRPLLASLLLTAPAPATELTIDALDPPAVHAGKRVTLPVNVSLEGPAGPLPGLSRPVDLTLDAPPAVRCGLADESVTLDPVTGQARTSLACRPLDPGQPAIRVTATSPPHAPGHWNGTLPVQPDRLTGTLEPGTPHGYAIPLRLDLAPAHLDAANVTVNVTGDLANQPLGFQLDPRPWTATRDGPLETSVPALHGPGTYEIAATASGARVSPFHATATVNVPEPPRRETLSLNVTVEPGQPRVTIASDEVNANGKSKRPGETLITRLETEHADQASVRVARRVGNASVTIARTSVPVDADGRAEHRFAHPVLPAGLVTVQARAGNSSVARTARIENVEPEAHLVGSTRALADGRALELELVLADANAGSTPRDPGPVWGLPDVSWRVFHGSSVVDGWNVTVGPFAGGPEGQAATSRIPWPNGTSWANVSTGQARMPLELDPPARVQAGTYRVSLYAPDGDRVGGAEIELAPAPRLALAAPEPTPGRAWPIQLAVENPVAGLQANLTVHLDGRPVTRHPLNGPGNTSVPLPSPLPAGTRVTVEANATWPGRPPSPRPDAVLTREVPDLGPRLSLAPVLDGTPTPAPLAVHPAHAHAIRPTPTAVDPNGDPVTLDATVQAPDGTPRDWNATANAGTLHVPANTRPGRYNVTITASSAGGTASASLLVDVGTITRLRLDGPASVELREGENTTVPVTVRNAGTVPVTTLLLSASGSPPLPLSARLPNGSVPLGAPVPVDLAPGGTRTLNVTVQAPPGSAGEHALALTAAGGPA